MALFTAGARAPVLWLSLEGDVDAPVFRLLTGLATVPARSVFTDPHLSAQQWTSLANVRDELEAIPLQVADAHGLSLGEIRATCLGTKNEGGLDLVIVDGIEGADDRLMGTLESLSEELDVPVVALVTLSDEAQDASADDQSWPRRWPLRKGSLILRVRRHPIDC